MNRALAAGKTTLLDVLAGRRRGEGVHGEVRVNGNLVDGHTLKALCGYVYQVSWEPRVCVCARARACSLVT